MTPRNEDFLFAQEAQRRGYLSEDQLEEGFLLQRRMLDELQIDERLAVILVKRGWLGEEQARRVYARIEPDDDQDEIEGYRIIEKVGRGAMGTVYKAVHLGLQRPVAIKVLRRDLARDQIQVERLKEEAKLLASLDHPNIVRAFDAGESRGFPFVVMEYVEGETLKERIARQGAIHEIDALRIARGIADALERARRMGVVHRDVKPGNIILTRKDEPKLMDLGLAKGPVDLGLTQHGATVGTPQYISPEQAQDPRRADTRSDIYSLGATLYAMVTGRPPFGGTTLAEVLTKVLYEAPDPPRVLNKKVSPEVGYLIERMMLKDPALRYRTPADVVHDIDEILAGRSIIPEGFTGNWEAYLLRRRIRRWTKIGVAAAVTVLVIAAGAFWSLQRAERLRALREGAQAVAEALVETEPLRTDGQVKVQERLAEARFVLKNWQDVEPEGLGRLRDRVRALERQTAYFGDLARLENDLQALMDDRNYAKALVRLDALAASIPGGNSPAEHAVSARRADVSRASAATLRSLRNEMLGTTARSLAGLLESHRLYRQALAVGLDDTPDVQAARDEVDQAIQALGGIREEVRALDTDFSADSLDASLRDLAFAAIGRTFEQRRQAAEDLARRAWARLDANGWIPWATGVRPLIEDVAFPRIEESLDDMIRARADAVLESATTRFTRGEGKAALALLTDLVNAAADANRQGIRADALDLRQSLLRTLDLERERAAEDYRAIEKDVLRFLREGDAAAIRGRLEQALASMDGFWPFRDEVEAMKALADAWDALLVDALDVLVDRLRVDEVTMRDGRREKRWFVKGSDRMASTVTVASTSGGVGRTRALADVHPEQLLAWVQSTGKPAPPLHRAVVALATLPDGEPSDLRPTVAKLRAVEDAFREARYVGGLSGWVNERGPRAWRDQRRREENARGAWGEAEHHFYMTKRYETALYYLNSLLTTGATLQATDFFDEHEGPIRDLYEQVRKFVANLKLSERFPGTGIGLDGEMTWMLFDWETVDQLESFRMGEGRATGRRERYHSRAEAVTPGGTNHRFHLLYGMEGLVRDRPFALPCIFDPAERIELTFTLKTLDSPFFLAIDIDGLQVGVLSADPTSSAYRQRWGFTDEVPRLHPEEEPPTLDFYGRGRGVAFHTGKGLGDPRRWEWPAAGRGREWPEWRSSRRLGKELFAFEPRKSYLVKVVRDRGRLTLIVDGQTVASEEQADWARIGRTSDRDRRIRANKGSGLIQIHTWTPQAIDDVRLQGIVLDRYRAE